MKAKNFLRFIVCLMATAWTSEYLIAPRLPVFEAASWATSAMLVIAGLLLLLALLNALADEQSIMLESNVEVTDEGDATHVINIVERDEDKAK